ncbi:MAG TPA: riboflavin synthase [Bacteroidetes bacterium]|nr:riboflavin synthase [Bacteroidota bacterium]HRR10092.1 riboflavin synthase [Rhodothermales bacterium]
MFTGIIENVGAVQSITELGGGRRFGIQSGVAPMLKVDQSIACNGVCLTVVALEEQVFFVEAIEETLRKTTLDGWKVGQRVNLERAMLLSARLDGHIVQGHVDTTGIIESVVSEETGWLFTMRFGPQYGAMVIPRGSIAIDGISLTVARLSEEVLTVGIIPYTFHHTVVSDWQVGTMVNVEFDLLGKYVVGWLEQRGNAT